MKNLQVMSWGLALAALTACVDLEEQLVGTVTTTYFTTPAGLEAAVDGDYARSEEHTSELQSRLHLVCRLLLEKKKKNIINKISRQIHCGEHMSAASARQI